jgi:hypothetical protein
VASDYCTLAELKATLSLTGESYADPDLSLAITAASRGIEDMTDRRFYLDSDANQIRYFTPTGAYRVDIDDLAQLTALATDWTGAQTFTQSWSQPLDFALYPLNAAADGEPYTAIEVMPRSGLYMPWDYPRSVRVTGKFGWPAVPEPIKQATMMLAARLVKQVREAPFGVAGFGQDGIAVRIAGQDPVIGGMLARYCRHVYA